MAAREWWMGGNLVPPGFKGGKDMQLRCLKKTIVQLKSEVETKKTRGGWVGVGMKGVEWARCVPKEESVLEPKDSGNWFDLWRFGKSVNNHKDPSALFWNFPTTQMKDFFALEYSLFLNQIEIEIEESSSIFCGNESAKNYL